MGSKGKSLLSRCLFNANKLETNDRLWNAMQPALQLATRFLLTNHPCITGIQDITNRYTVPDHLYKNRTDQDPNEVKFRVKSDPQPLDPDHLPSAQRLQSFPGFSPIAVSQRVLEKALDLRLESAFYSSGQYKEHCIARTVIPGITCPDSPINVTIDAELLWMLLSDKYSKSEKMMASLVFAASLAHEMMVSASILPRRDKRHNSQDDHCSMHGRSFLRNGCTALSVSGSRTLTSLRHATIYGTSSAQRGNGPMNPTLTMTQLMKLVTLSSTT